MCDLVSFGLTLEHTNLSKKRSRGMRKSKKFAGRDREGILRRSAVPPPEPALVMQRA